MIITQDWKTFLQDNNLQSESLRIYQFPKNERQDRLLKKNREIRHQLKEKIKKKCQKLLNPYSLKFNNLDTRAIGNAIRHSTFPYYTNLSLITNSANYPVGYSLTVIQNSEFSYSKIVKKYRTQKKYFHYGGGGFKYYFSKDVKVFFKSKGKKVILLHLN